MELCKEIINVIEAHEFTMNEVEKQDNEYYIEMGQSTPAGEDWWEIIWFDGTNDGFVEAVKERYLYFDVDEEAEYWIRGRGQNGIPNSIRTLLEDAKWKKAMLEGLSDALTELKTERELE